MKETPPEVIAQEIKAISAIPYAGATAAHYFANFHKHTHGIWDCGLRNVLIINGFRNPQSAIPNPKSVVYIIMAKSDQTLLPHLRSILTLVTV